MCALSLSFSFFGVCVCVCVLRVAKKSAVCYFV